MKLLLIATYPTLSTGYARIANRLGNYLAGLPGVEVWHFGFENYTGVTVSDRFVDPRIRIIDVASRVEPSKDRFGTTLIKDFVYEEVKPDEIIIYNDVVVSSWFHNQFMTKDRPFKITTYLDLVYPWETLEFLEHIDRWSDRVFVFSPIWRDHLVDDVGFDPAKVGVFKHGFDADIFRPMNKASARRKLNLDPGDYIVLNTNRNSYRKALDVTIFGFLRFWKALGCPENVKLFLNCRMDVTDGYDVPNLIRVECTRLGVSYDQVSSRQILTMGDNAAGLLSDETLNALYNAADVGLNTCVGEGFGLCNLEGAGLGVPQVVTDTGGLHDIFGGEGRLPASYGCRVVKPRATLYLAKGIDSHGGEIAITDPDDFSNALREVYDGTLETSRLRDHVLATYDWDAHLEKFARDVGLARSPAAPSLAPSLQPSASARSPSARSLPPSPSARSVPIYWINLDRREDRRAAMEAQFERFGVTNHHRIRAVDGRSKEGGMTAEIACMQSHFEAIRRAYLDEPRADAALILEDDVVFFEETGIPNAPLPIEDFDIVQLHYCCPALLEWAAENVPPAAAGAIVLKGYMMSCACYLISRAGMQRFLDRMAAGPDLRLDARFLPNARAEEFVYRYVPRVFCPLLPAVTIAVEEFESDVPSSDHAAGRENARVLGRIPQRPAVAASKKLVVVPLPYDVHWFDESLGPKIKSQLYSNNNENADARRGPVLDHRHLSDHAPDGGVRNVPRLPDGHRPQGRGRVLQGIPHDPQHHRVSVVRPDHHSAALRLLEREARTAFDFQEVE